MDDQSKELLSGTVIQDRYRVVRLLGKGGMGEVYEVEHIRFGRRLALKRLLPQFADNAAIVDRFQREARAAAMIGNTHIIEVTDMGELPDGSPYIVLEYLDGEDLKQLFYREGPLPVARTVRIALQVCDALAAAHAKGIVHRDLKPANVFLVKDRADFVKILDFGISKILEHSSEEDGHLTSTGQALGTPYYMSLEQAQGKKDIDGRADIYSVGVILFVMLTGELPFQSNTFMSIMMELLSQEPPAPRSLRPDLPPELERVILTAMARDRQYRYQTIEELAAALRPFGELDPNVAATADRPPAGADPEAVTRPEAEGATPVPAETRTTKAADSVDPTAGTVAAEAAPEPAPPSREPPPPTMVAPSPAPDVSRPAPAPTDSPAARPASPPARSWVPLLVAGGVLVLGFVALIVVNRVWAPEPERAPESTPSEPPRPREAPQPPVQAKTSEVPNEVRIQIVVRPANAKIFVGDAEYPNPTDAFQPRSMTPVRIRIELDGHQTIEELAIFDQDRSFEYTLEPGSGVKQVETGGRRHRAHDQTSRPGPDETPAKVPAEAPPAEKTPPTDEVYRGPSGTIRTSFE
jgi:serine/threonine-protein kinase